MDYADKKAWFAQKITVWWIKTVSWPHHLKTHRNFNALLILDNWSAQKYLDDSDVTRKVVLQDKLCIVVSPPNIASRIQPADLGIIAVLKVGYNLFWLEGCYLCKKIKSLRILIQHRKGKIKDVRVWRLVVKLMSLMHLRS